MTVTETESAGLLTVTDWPLPPVISNVTGMSCVARAVTLASVVVPVAIVAVSVLTPTRVPRVQLPTDALPLPSVVAVMDATVPVPDAVKYTVTPATGLPYWSLTVTDGTVPTAVATVADCPPLPATKSICCGMSARPVAVSVTAVTEPLTIVTVKVFVPAVVLRNQFAPPTPKLFVAIVDVPGYPLPLALKYNVTSGTGFPKTSVTTTLAGPTDVPTVPDEAGGAPKTAIVVGCPDVYVTEIGLVLVSGIP